MQTFKLEIQNLCPDGGITPRYSHEWPSKGLEYVNVKENEVVICFKPDIPVVNEKEVEA